MKTRISVLASMALMAMLLLFTTADVFSQTVYTTRTGEKYHADGCQYLSKSKIETTLDQAKKNGYTACSVCKPGGATKAVIKTSTSVQCSGTTKAGARCKRKTTSSTGRCYQH